MFTCYIFHFLILPKLGLRFLVNPHPPNDFKFYIFLCFNRSQTFTCYIFHFLIGVYISQRWRVEKETSIFHFLINNVQFVFCLLLRKSLYSGKKKPLNKLGWSVGQINIICLWCNYIKKTQNLYYISFLF